MERRGGHAHAREDGMAEQGTVLVTGAAQGMGLATSRLAAAMGYRIAMVDRQAERLRAAAAAIDGARPYVADLLDAGGLEGLVEQVEDECGPLRGLVNNAGIVKTQPLLDVTLEDWEAIFGVNARAAFLVARDAGAIVNVASVAGRSARPQQTMYGASKAALLHLTRSAAAAFGPHGVRVNAVCPGVIRTEMTEQIWRDRRPEDVERILRSIPLGHTGAPEEVASVVVWLLGDGASYVNGQAINVCGGLEMD
jgi:NAD(P)-dependent dehydrogenase (short-subunit alcohol dehydrogenase family)